MRESMIENWHAAFSDPEGGFYERLDRHLKTENLPKRLLTQCRQLFVYGSEGMDVEREWQYMVDRFRVPETGGWRFSEVDAKYDFYAHAFVLLACATLKKYDVARQTIDFVHAHFRVPGRPGFVSTLDPHLNPVHGARAQNPHMHFFEGVLAMAEVSDDPVYARQADELLDLIFDHFYDGVIREFHDGESVHIVEAGHQSEWIWLLSRYRDVLKRDDLRIAPAMETLHAWVRRHGIDRTHGGIFNMQEKSGVILDEKKRIWPVCETLRAAAVMQDLEMLTDMRAILRGYYLRPDGFWNEMLNRDLSVAGDYLPGTTVYHLYQILRI